MTKLGVIWVQDCNGITGTGTAMSWYVPADFRYSRESMMGCPIIMDRRSQEALGRVLPGRANVIIIRGPGYEVEGALVVPSVDEALQIVREEMVRTGASYIWITGGVQLYVETFPLLDEAVATDLELDVTMSAPGGSTFVHTPALDPVLWRRDEERSDAERRERSGDVRWKMSTWVQRQAFPRSDACPAKPRTSYGAFVIGCTVPSSPLLTNPTLRALAVIALFTYTAQNMLSVSIAPLSRALGLPEWIVSAAVSLAAAVATAFSQFQGCHSIVWGRRCVILLALFLALTAGTLFSAAVWARAAGYVGVFLAAGAIMAACGPFFGVVVAAILPTGQAPVVEVTSDEASRIRGMSTFSGTINLPVMIGSLASPALGAWWIFGPVHATPIFVLIALAIVLICLPRDGDPACPNRHLPRLSAEDTTPKKAASASPT